MRRLRSLGWLTLVLALLLAPAAAQAQDTSVGIPVAPPSSPTVPPPGFKTTARQAIAIAKRQPEVQKVLREHPRAIFDAQVFGNWRWQIDVAAKNGDRALVDVDISPYGNVIDVWSGISASTYLARGHFDTTMRQPWVWCVFGLLFLAPFIDPRRLRRQLHLDLLVLLSFGFSYLFFERAHPETAILLVYPPLVYFLIRMLRAGLRPRQARGRLVPYLPTAALAVGVIALFGARVALNVNSHKVMDIGYASVVGADRIDHKQQLYVDNDTHGDTYGPVNYLAYIPFEARLSVEGGVG